MLAGAFALRVAGQGGAAGRLEAAAAVAVSACDAEQHAEVWNVPADGRSEIQTKQTNSIEQNKNWN